ncbi:ATP-binding cassette domain-containing protein [Reichenbachiella sp. MALMAid0571]|uniref:MutS-related protein n=1 Tax=Reichenbachiella sp. MALMAid0571 TaxID=3143939 RepID=UPI0032E04511
MGKHELEADSIIKSYGHIKVLSNVYLKCSTGEVLGILGRNGCGKSTLLKIIYGTEHTHDKSIRVNKRVYSKLYEARGLAAYLPQKAFLPKGISLRRIAAIFIDAKDKRNEILNDKRISKHLNKDVSELSGGELRYFEVLLLVNLPVKFILLDEPFSGIEPLYREAIKELIDQHSSGKGFIITDHDYRNIIEASDRIILLTNGSCKPIEQLEQLEDLKYLPVGTFTAKTNSEDNEISELSFLADQQTLKDLDLFENGTPGSLLALFDQVQTKGGREVLHKMFKTPSQNLNVLKSRRDSIQFFYASKTQLLLDSKQIDFVEYYITSDISISKDSKLNSFISNIENRYRVTNDYYIKETGIEKTIGFLNYLNSLLGEFAKENLPMYLSKVLYEIEETLGKEEIRRIRQTYDTNSGIFYLGKYDCTFRKQAKDDILFLLNCLYELEAYASIATAMSQYNLVCPEYVDSTDPMVEIGGMFHPSIVTPVSNDIKMSPAKNLCFLTGANMSGKSTFLKSFGICVYLAHLGFPVPAKKMSTSIFNGLNTTINLSDDINKGYSHFYSEVKRVKDAALSIKKNNKMIFIFDELFRGTSVKDAFDASFMVTSGFLKIHLSLFLISTHIVEIATELKEHENVIFKCFQTKFQNDMPVYDYKLKDGVSKESLGLVIVKNEKILEILKEAAENQKRIEEGNKNI